MRPFGGNAVWLESVEAKGNLKSLAGAAGLL
jgi:hypothetical protein